MDKLLKILFVEDLETDLELAVRELQKAGLNFDYKCVDTKDTFMHALKEFFPDLIISDYSMPIFNGKEALKFAIEFDRALPFILLTGSINESVAVDCMKAGAWDYVLKDSLARLPFAVKEALEKKRIHKAKEEAEKSLILNHERLNRAMNVGNLAWWEMTLPSGAVTFNHRKTDMLGYPQENFNHYRDFTNLVHPDDLDATMKAMTDHLSGIKPSYEIDYRIMRSDGEYLWFHDVGLITKRDDDGNPLQITGMVLDINDRKIAEINLGKSEYINKTLVEHLPQIIFIKDTKSNYITCNTNYANLLGIAVNDIIGKNDFDFFPSDLANSYRADDQEVIKNGILKDIEENYFQHGEMKWIHTIKVPFRDENSNIIGVLGMFEDITERKKASEKLFLQSNALNAAANAILITNPDGTIEWVNSAFSKLTGYSDLEAIGKNPRDLVKSGKHEIEFYKNLWDTVLSGTIWRGEMINKHKNGTLYTEEQTITPMFDENGMISHFISIKEDITARKSSEEALLISEEKYRKVVDNIHDALIIEDIHGSIVFANEEFCKMFGFSNDELATLSLKDYTSPDSYEDVSKRHIERMKGIDVPNEFIYRGIRKDGVEIWIETRVSLLIENNKIIGTQSIERDITRRKQDENELIIAKDKAEEMSRLKSSFLANMSHEIRTPMNGIIGFAGILETEDDVEEMHKIGKVILKSSVRLMETLNSILNLSLIESGELLLEFQTVNIVALINEAISTYKATAEKKSLYISLLNNFDELIVKSEPKILRNIINNLIDNAIKFTTTGGITITINLDSIENQQVLILKVKDTGIGIVENNFDTIFSEFRQVSEGLNRSFEGTGLGLTLCRKYLKNLNGSIDIESKINEGSTFTVKLPVLVLNEKLLSYQPEDDIAQSNLNITLSENNAELPRILYVEDDDASVMIVRKYLENLCRVDIVNNAKDAVAIAKDNFYDLILMDINLGIGESGVWATRQIRKIESYNDIPIIAFTAFAISGDKEEFLDAGCTDYLSKPFSPNELLSLLTKYIKHK